MTSEKNKSKNTPHDQLVKKVLENPVSAREFLDEYLTIEFKEFIDLSTLKIEKESYVEDSLKKRLSDVVYSVNTKSNEKAFVYILAEHQTEPDYWMALRLWQYSLLLCERHKKRKNKLPLVIPLVLYNGKKKYNAPRNIWELFDNPLLAKQAMANDYQLIDLQAMSDDDIDYEKHLSFVLYVMKHIYARDMLKMLDEAMKRCHKAIIIDKDQDYLHTKLILWYTDSKVPDTKKQELEQLIVDNLPKPDIGGVMRTIADSYRDEGRDEGIALGIEKGREEGAINIAIRMLKEGAEIKFVSRVTNLSTRQLQELQDKNL